jgi:glycerol-3-phosphate acyltransferase PlsY
VFESQVPLLIFSVIMALLIIYKHRANIARLRAGTEPRFATAKPQA